MGTNASAFFLCKHKICRTEKENITIPSKQNKRKVKVSKKINHIVAAMFSHASNPQEETYQNF